MLLFEEKWAGTHSGIAFALLVDTWTRATFYLPGWLNVGYFFGWQKREERDIPG